MDLVIDMKLRMKERNTAWQQGFGLTTAIIDLPFTEMGRTSVKKK